MQSELTDLQSELLYEHRMGQLADRAHDSMLGFIKYMNPDFRINWHHRLIARYLDKFVAGEIIRLMIFLQPQIGKTEMVSRNLPPYIYGKDPSHKIIASTYGDSYASSFNLDTQKIIDTDKYRKLFPKVRLVGMGEDDENYVRNSRMYDIIGTGGKYQSVGVGGALTGRTGNTLLIDDPIKNWIEAQSEAYRERLFKWFTTVARTRLKKTKDGKPPKILITCTRWHEDGLEARLLAMAKANPKLPQWTVLMFPAIKEGTDCHPEDPRQEGEALWPEMISVDELEEIKQADARGWSALYQQRPSPESGEIFKRQWWKFYDKLPENFDKIIQSWDLTFKKTKKSDFVVGQVWGKVGARKYLIDQVRGRMGFNEQIGAFISVTQKYPLASGKLVEEAANGAALIDTLQSKIHGIIPIRPTDSKENRAKAISPQVQAGDIWLPSPSIAPWINDYIEEHASFPNGVNDDQVDATSQGITHLTDREVETNWTPISLTGASKWLK